MSQSAFVPDVAPEFVPPPRGEDLPYDDGVPMESYIHRLQMNLLIETLDLHTRDRGDTFIGGNMFLYYSAEQARRSGFRGPDFFVVLGAGRHPRRSWVVWEEEGRRPDVVVELSSRSTAAEDRGPKKKIYARLKVGQYVMFDPDTAAIEVFRLENGHEYRPVAALPSGRYVSPPLGLELGTWQGEYFGPARTWLRWFTPDGEVLPTEGEVARREAARADAEAERAAREAERAAREAEKAGKEAHLRAEAEQRAEALAREVAELRSRLAGTPGAAGGG